jgi:hypothetical protein
VVRVGKESSEWDFSDLDGWKVEGSAAVDGGYLSASGKSLVICDKRVAEDKYVVTMRFKRVKSSGTFDINFGDFRWSVSSTNSSVSYENNELEEVDGKLVTNKWYDFRIVVDGSSVRGLRFIAI